MSRLIAAAPAMPLWTSLGSAMRQTLRNFTAPAVDASAFEALDSEQARIRQTARMWLVG